MAIIGKNILKLGKVSQLIALGLIAVFSVIVVSCIRNRATMELVFWLVLLVPTAAFLILDAAFTGIWLREDHLVLKNHPFYKKIKIDYKNIVNIELHEYIEIYTQDGAVYYFPGKVTGAKTFVGRMIEVVETRHPAPSHPSGSERNR